MWRRGGAGCENRGNAGGLWYRQIVLGDEYCADPRLWLPGSAWVVPGLRSFCDPSKFIPLRVLPRPPAIPPLLPDRFKLARGSGSVKFHPPIKRHWLRIRSMKGGGLFDQKQVVVLNLLI